MSDDKDRTEITSAEEDAFFVSSEEGDILWDDKTLVSADDSTHALDPDQTLPSQLDIGDKTQVAAATPGRGGSDIGPGCTLKDRFLIEKTLGEGGMGAVFLAVDQRKVEARHRDPHVAIKLIRGDFALDAEAFISLQRETDKSQKLAHPNIITVYDFDRDGDTFFMTMEALRGNTLDVVIKAEARDSLKAKSHIADLAKAIAYAHRRNIVHSDLKPGNVFVTEEGTLKVLDFGIARALSNVEGAQDFDDVGEVVGLTPAYASCEMFEEADPHPADDVYAIGILAYQLFTGKHPFDRKKAIVARTEGLKPARIPGLSAYQWQAIRKALAFNREHRWQDAGEFLDKFTGTGRRVKQLALALVIAFAGFGAYLAVYEPEAGPDIPFEMLSVETQQAVRNSLKEATLAERFGDLNGMLFYLDQAYSLHPRNPDVMAQMDVFIDKVVSTQQQSVSAVSPEQLAQIDELLKYPSLAQNPRLVKLRDEVETTLQAAQ